MAGSTNVGSIHYELGIDTSKFDAAQGKIKEKTGAMSSGFDTLGKIGAGAAIAVGAAITAALVVNMDRAIQRIDTLNNFPKVMKNLGYETGASSEAIKKLEAGVKGLPTSLSDIASAMQNIAPSAKSLDEATSLTLALNNALLAGGKPMAMQATAMEQFSQAISKGKPDMMEWRTLATAMPGQLDQIAQSLGYGRGEWQKMASDVSDNILPFDKVKEAIVKLNTQGLGEFPSFAEQAKNASGGLQSAMANANTAIARGIASVITSIGSASVASAITKFGSLMEGALKSSADAIKTFSDYLKNNKGSLYVFTGAAIGLAVALGVALAPAIWGVVTAIGAAALAAAPFILAGAAIAGIAFLIKQNWDKISPIVDMAKNAFMQFWNMITPFREWVVSMFVSAWDSLKRAFESVRQAVEPFMPQLKILGILIAVAVLTPIALAVGAILLFIGVVTVVITVLAWLIAKVIEVGAWFFNLGSKVAQAMGQFVGSISQKIGEAINWFAGLPGRILGALGNLGGTLYNAGSSMIGGLINGISNGAGAVIQKIKDICASALGAVKKFFGIKSPSKVMAIQGDFIMAGLGVGIEKGTKSVMSSAEDSMNRVSSMMNGTAALNTVLSSSVRQSSLSQQGQGQAGGNSANVYVYGDTILNGETDQQAYLDRLAGNFIDITRGAATI